MPVDRDDAKGTEKAQRSLTRAAPGHNTPGGNCAYLTWETPLSQAQRETVAKIRNPTKWPPREKHFVCGLSILTTFMAAYSISAYVSGVGAIALEFRSARVVALVGMLTFQTAFAAAPMFLAPLSEFVGRKPVFLVTYLLFNCKSTPFRLSLTASELSKV
jgi:hypothetical protein